MAETLFQDDEVMRRDAVISDDGFYRYGLSRVWDDAAPLVGFLMLNPSTADALIDDPTIRRCVGFARAWGFGGLMVANLFAMRATNPRELYKAFAVVGPENDEAILFMARKCRQIVAAWGCHGAYLGRDRAVVSLLKDAGNELHCLGTTKDGHPKHPLYLPADAERIPFEVR